MAALAFRFDVLPQQRKSGAVVIKLGRLFPAALRMAARAVFAQRFLVLVILLVAGVTLLAQLVAIHIAAMAILAPRATVLTPQGIAGVRVVIEGSGLPLLGRMTGVTTFAEAAFVALLLIVLFMAADATQRCALVDAPLVTVRTLGIQMLAQQGKAGGVVVKLRVLPGAL